MVNLGDTMFVRLQQELINRRDQEMAQEKAAANEAAGVSLRGAERGAMVQDRKQAEAEDLAYKQGGHATSMPDPASFGDSPGFDPTGGSPNMEAGRMGQLGFLDAIRTRNETAQAQGEKRNLALAGLLSKQGIAGAGRTSREGIAEANRKQDWQEQGREHKLRRELEATGNTAAQRRANTAAGSRTLRDIMAQTDRITRIVQAEGKSIDAEIRDINKTNILSSEQKKRVEDLLAKKADNQKKVDDLRAENIRRYNEKTPESLLELETIPSNPTHAPGTQDSQGIDRDAAWQRLQKRK